MAIPEQSFRIGVLGGGAVVVVVITVLRFCGSVALPPKPPAPVVAPQTARQLVTQASAQTPIYEQFLHDDARTAMVEPPSLDAMSRKLPHRFDDSTHVLQVGVPIETVGLRLKLEANTDSLTLRIDNLSAVPVAYRVDTETGMGNACNSARALPFDAMVLQKNGSETRVECINRPDTRIVVKDVEVIELNPLEAYYVDHLSPVLVGIEPRFTRGHHPPGQMCSNTISQAVRSGLENKEITWGDLVDFYARHNCARYQFPSFYRAFKSDGERALPATEAGM